jgi:ABC-2 type transport system ATP-binding protein
MIWKKPMCCAMSWRFSQGRLAVMGKPNELKARVGSQADLDDVFVHFSGAVIEHGGNYRDVRDSRNTFQRLG